MNKLLDPLCKLNLGARLPSISANSFVIGEARDIRLQIFEMQKACETCAKIVGCLLETFQRFQTVLGVAAPELFIRI